MSYPVYVWILWENKNGKVSNASPAFIPWGIFSSKELAERASKDMTSILSLEDEREWVGTLSVETVRMNQVSSFVYVTL